ncbi:hypothetical protein TIFTF001_022358 [Ficus carica]|uniref:Ubiquitin-like protease family profile domain-containing protein n=1 Tax=Ficus carica TaxID=3494 RepID=A0AA88AHN9_FICCA|nr:hypothetical protein TIFTF001_022358 [Ficus carica]
MPTEEELKDPWVAQLYLKNPKVVPQLPPKTSVPRPSSDTNFEWREFQKEIRGQVDSMNKKLEDLKKGQKKSTKLLRRVFKLLSDNMIEKGQGKAHTAYHVSSRQKINVQTDESDALKTTSNDIGTGSQDDVFIDSDIGAVADMGVQAAMEFLTANKVIVSHEDVEEEKNKTESMPDPEKEKEKEKDDKESIREQDVIKLEEPANEESIGDMIPKKKRVRLSRLGQRWSGPMTKVGSPSNAPSKFIYALPPSLTDEPPKEKLEEFREWIKKRSIEEDSSRSWFEVNTLLIPINLADLKHWALVKLDLTNWTIEVYDSLQHEGPHNFKIREGVECLSKFIPLLADRLSLFEFKPREPPRIYPILVTIMKDIPQQANGGDCRMFTIKYVECWIEGTLLQKGDSTTALRRPFFKKPSWKRHKNTERKNVYENRCGRACFHDGFKTRSWKEAASTTVL